MLSLLDPEEEDELELSPGDLVAVEKIYSDGWAYGSKQDTNESGTFPLDICVKFDA
jgi:hypothetical protein